MLKPVKNLIHKTERFAQITFLLCITVFSGCLNETHAEYKQPELIKNVFPTSFKIDDLKVNQFPYFNLIEYDISESRNNISKRQVRKEANESYKFILNYEPDSINYSSYDSLMINKKNQYTHFKKKKIIDSILIPEEMKKQLENILFMDFSQKPYFNEKYKGYIGNPDSISVFNWKWMRNKLQIFNDQNMLVNFNKIACKINKKSYQVPYGLLLLRDSTSLCWYIPIGWEYKAPQIAENDTSEEKHYYLGHILGYIYNFDFSMKLYQFECM